MISVNSRFILEPYIKEALKAKVQGGIAMPGQRDGLKGLKLLVDGLLPNGDKVPAGSTAYIREEILYTHQWASKILTLEGSDMKFILVDLQHIDCFDIKEPSPARVDDREY